LDPQQHLEGIQLLNSGNYFEAHEVLEDVWREAPVDEKKFWQGLVQVAVALHHHSTGNLVGAKSVMARAARNLGPCSSEWQGMKIGELKKILAKWQGAVHRGEDTTPPTVTFVDC
jgi:uncharacterized protein